MKHLTLSILSFLFAGVIFGQTYWQQEVNYTIQVKLDDKNHTISGFDEFEYVNNSPDNLDRIYIHLWPNAYRNGKTALGKQQYAGGETILRFGASEDLGGIDSLDFKLNGQSVKWEYDATNIDIAVILLPIPLLPGQRVSVSTPFKVKIPSGSISRLGHIDQSYQITQWYPKPAVYDKNGWNPIPYLNQGEFYSEYGSFDVSITLPKNYVVAATGDLQTQSEIDFLNAKASETQKRFGDYLEEKAKKTPFPESSSEFKTIRFTQSKVHDFAWFADKRYGVLKGEVTLPQSKRKVTSWAMFVPQNAAIWTDAIEYINDGTYYYSLWNGDYPYNNVTAVDGTISAGGGMEYPNVTVIGNTSSKEELEVVIVHEVGHNWFYGILGSNERVHGWMDEGMNTLNEVRYIQTKYPDNTRLSDMVLNGSFHFDDLGHHDLSDIAYRMTAAIGEDQPIETNSAEFSPLNYGTIMYMKTGLVFYYLKDYLGEKLFDDCMHAYFEEWKFKHPQPEDMKATLERISKKELDWLFHDLIQTTNHVDYKLSSVKSSDRGTVVKVKNKGQVDGPIEINVFKNDELVETHWVEPGQKNTRIDLTTKEADRVELDASKEIPEMYRQNNTWSSDKIFKKLEPIKLEFLSGYNQVEKSELYWTPIMAGNAYDQFMIGAAFHNMGISPNRFQYLVAPMYSFGRQMVSGIAEFSYTCLPKTNFKVSRFGVSVKSFKNDSSFTRNQQGAYLALAPYWFTKIGNRTNTPISQSFLIQGIVKADIQAITSTDYVGGFAKYNFSVSQPDHKLSINLRTDVIFSSNTDMARVTADATYRFRYMKNAMKRWVELRGFIGNTYHYKTTLGYKEYRLGMSMSGTDGQQDLFFEDYYFGRGMVNGLWSQQRDENMGGFKSTAYYGSTNNWMASGNLYLQLPIPKIGVFGLFADLGAFHNGVSLNSMVNTGVGMRLGKVFGLYFPIWMSKELSDSFGNSKYAEKIRFTLKMNLVNKGIKLSSLMN